MFARLLGPGKSTFSRFGRNPRPARPSYVGPQKSTLSDAQLDHLLTYWASGKPQATTATVKAQLFLDHVRVKLMTDEKVENALRQVVGKTAFTQTAATAIINVLIDATRAALKNARPDPNMIPADGRYGVGLRAFDQELSENLGTIEDKPTKQTMHKVGFDRLKNLIVDALKRTAHETLLAEQLRDTARKIRKLEELQDGGKLPPEDLYELKLRRELFVADHAMYVRITRAAIERVRLITRSTATGSGQTPDFQNPHHALSRIFASVSQAARSAFSKVRDMTNSSWYNA